MDMDCNNAERLEVHICDARGPVDRRDILLQDKMMKTHLLRIQWGLKN